MRLAFTSIGALAILIAGTIASAQMTLTGAGKTTVAAAGGCCTIDATVTGTAGTAAPGLSTLVITLSSSQANDIIALCIGNTQHSGQGSSSANVSTVSGGSLTWAKRAGVTTSTASLFPAVETWWALAASTLTAAVITVTWDKVIDIGNIIPIGINGSSNTGAPWDADGSLPATKASTNVEVPTVSGVSTTASNTVLLGCMNSSSGGVQTAGSGYTLAGTRQNPAGFGLDTTAVQYKIVSATQSSVSVTFGSSASSYQIIGDAVR